MQSLLPFGSPDNTISQLLEAIKKSSSYPCQLDFGKKASDLLENLSIKLGLSADVTLYFLWSCAVRKGYQIFFEIFAQLIISEQEKEQVPYFLRMEKVLAFIFGKEGQNKVSLEKMFELVCFFLLESIQSFDFKFEIAAVDKKSILRIPILGLTSQWSQIFAEISDIIERGCVGSFEEFIKVFGEVFSEVVLEGKKISESEKSVFERFYQKYEQDLCFCVRITEEFKNSREKLIDFLQLRSQRLILFLLKKFSEI